ncbi:MAG: GAF domain-containing protein, partial [Anaerolineae bacterium]|nr:GAF domain-containing protein [Anaerolineae bacterium]
GINSAGWILFLWPVMVIGMLTQPRYSYLSAVGVALYYVILYILTYYAGYRPLLNVELIEYRFLIKTFGFLMVLGGGGISYLNTHSFKNLLAKVQQTTEILENTQRTLEDRVTARTAELTHRARQFQAIAEFNQATTNVLDLEELLEMACRLISERFEYYHVGIFLIDKLGEWADLRAVSSPGGQRMLDRGHRLRVADQGLVGYVARTGRARIASDVGTDIVWVPNPDLPDTHSEMALPLETQGRIMGVLDIQSHYSEAFDQSDIEVLQVLADTLAVVIQNTILFQESRETIDRLERYQQTEAFQAWRQSLSRRGRQIHYAYSRGESRVVEITALDQEDGFEEAAQERPYGGDLVRTVPTEEGNYLLIAPVVVQSRKLGELSFELSRPWRKDEIQLAQEVVEQLALALNNARLLEESRLRALQERARSEVVSRIRASGSVDAILRSTAQELGRILQVERSRIQLEEQEHFVSPDDFTFDKKDDAKMLKGFTE